MQQTDLAIHNRLGLHARPAALFVEAARQFESRLTLVKSGKRANAKSILGIMSLDVRSGDTITLEADGPDEAAALAALSGLVAGGLGEAADRGISGEH